MKITNITKVNAKSIRYDLEVQNNKNFFANGILVHNSSMTVYYYDGDFGVCSHNINLKETDTNAFWQMARKDKLIDKLVSLGKNYAIQGELCGPKIQGNIYDLKESTFFLFDVYDIDEQRYLSPAERFNFAIAWDIRHAPVLNSCFKFDESTSIKELLELAEDKSVINGNTEREGLVFKCLTNQLSFKAVSNKYLLRSKD